MGGSLAAAGCRRRHDGRDIAKWLYSERLTSLLKIHFWPERAFEIHLVPLYVLGIAIWFAYDVEQWVQTSEDDGGASAAEEEAGGRKN